MSVGDLLAHLDIMSSDKSYYSPRIFFYEASDYTVGNARLTLSNIELGLPDRLRVSAWIRNATDEEYVIYSPSDTSAAFNAPRMSAVDFTYSY